MNRTNYEIKAKVTSQKQKEIRDYLKNENATFIGKDFQIDTYFKVQKGRLKIRKGNIENKLIYYERDNRLDSKKSEALLIDLNKSKYLENIIKKTHDVLIEVEKNREIYLIENVKFHIDEVRDLGRFIEIEAISEDNRIPLEKIKEQCDYYKNKFKINNSELIKNSYSDMLLNKK